jgi:hypothetical protein
MNSNPAALLNPIFNALDDLIENDDVYLYLVFVWLSLVMIAWVLSGGLRRNRPRGNPGAVAPSIIITMHPPPQSLPAPIIVTEIDPTWDNGDETLNEP